MTELGNNSGSHLLSFIERVEKLNEEIKGLQDDRKEIFSEAAGSGFGVKALKRVIRERAMDRDELDEFEALVQTYWGALGRR